jgi:serine/threonine-protein kinase RCK2
MSTIQNLKNFIRHGKQARAADHPRDQPTTNLTPVHAQQQKHHGYAAGDPTVTHRQQQPQQAAVHAADARAVDSRNVVAPASGTAAQTAGKNQNAIVAEEREEQGKLPRYPGLERYHLVQKMGDGAFSNVYRAMDSHTNSEVAIKVVRKFEMNLNQVCPALGTAHFHFI